VRVPTDDAAGKRSVTDAPRMRAHQNGKRVNLTTFAETLTLNGGRMIDVPLNRSNVLVVLKLPMRG